MDNVLANTTPKKTVAWKFIIHFCLSLIVSVIRVSTSGVFLYNLSFWLMFSSFKWDAAVECGNDSVATVLFILFLSHCGKDNSFLMSTDKVFSHTDVRKFVFKGETMLLIIFHQR